MPFREGEPSRLFFPSCIYPQLIDLAIAPLAGTLAVSATSQCRATVGVENCAGHYGSFKGMQGIQLGLNGFLTGLSYLWKRSEQQSSDRHPQWWVIPLGMTAFNTYRIAAQYGRRCP